MSAPVTEEERLAFWRAGMKRCVRCDADVTEEHVVDGCRFNGDAWGVDVFGCPRCGWRTSFKFDEYQDGVYYFETQGWTR